MLPQSEGLGERMGELVFDTVMSAGPDGGGDGRDEGGVTFAAEHGDFIVFGEVVLSTLVEARGGLVPDERPALDFEAGSDSEGVLVLPLHGVGPDDAETGRTKNAEELVEHDGVDSLVLGDVVLGGDGGNVFYSVEVGHVDTVGRIGNNVVEGGVRK